MKKREIQIPPFQLKQKRYQRNQKVLFLFLVGNQYQK